MSRRSLVILGASNVSRAMDTIVNLVQGTDLQPMDLYFVAGRGRAYAIGTSFVFRRLPSIRECGVWDALDRSDVDGLSAVITDIGNDIIFGESPEAVADAVEACIRRLDRRGADIVMSLLPVANTRSVTPLKTGLLKTVAPRALPLTADDIVDGVRDLQERLLALGDRYGVHMVDQDPSWYGFDPIHYKVRLWPEVWKRLLRPLYGPLELHDRFRPTRWVRLQCARAETQYLGSVPTGRPQPAIRMRSGLDISLY